MMRGKKRSIPPASDGGRCPYLSKLDKGIAPDPLPRIPPFLPERSFSTRATFPVRAASSSSWSLPMVGNRAAPAHPAGGAAARGTAAPSAPSPDPASQQSTAEIPAVLPHQQEQQQEGGGESPPPSFTGSFLGGVWKRRRGGEGEERGQ